MPLALAAAVLLAGCATAPFDFANPFERAGADDSGRGAWEKEGEDDAAKRSDMRECYQVAQARVARDREIDADIAAGEDRSVAPAGGSAALLSNMRASGYEQREDHLFVRCMREKGYSRK